MRAKMMRPSTPKNLQIESRDLHFKPGDSQERWWVGGDPVATAFFNTLSAAFPMGERYFIETVRRFRDVGDTRLQAQIAAFITQESLHTREHLVFNAVATERGYDFSRIEALLTRRFDWARGRGPLEQLAGTIALEHFTAILAHALLTDPRELDAAPEQIRRLWTWHAIEEIEHKAVAYDTFLAATQHMSGLRRWLLRNRTMLIATTFFVQEIIVGASESFRQDKINTPRTWFRFARYLCVTPGMLRRALGNYFKYFKPGFHPWGVDDRSLIAKFEPNLA